MGNDYLYIRECELACRVGTTKEEQAFPQILKVSWKMELPLGPAGRSDKLMDTADYAAIIDDIRRMLAKNTFNLVEAVAETIAGKILESPPIRAVEVTVEKKVFAGIEGVGVCIRRERGA